MLKYHIQTSGRSPARAGDPVQRHPHHAAGAVRAVRQLQLPAHQRLRRGDHHADRGERAPRGGDPADHQQGAGPQQQRRTPGRARSSIEQLTDLVEEAVYKEFEAHRRARRRARRDGDDVPARQDPGREPVLRDTKHDGSLPIIGVNTFLPSRRRATRSASAELIRSTEEEKQDAGRRRCARSSARNAAAPAGGARAPAGRRPRPAATCSRELMETVKVCSLGQISRALYAGRRPVPPQHVADSARVVVPQVTARRDVLRQGAASRSGSSRRASIRRRASWRSSSAASTRIGGQQRFEDFDVDATGARDDRAARHRAARAADHHRRDWLLRARCG